MKQRVLAIIGAVAIVAIAVVARGKIHPDDGSHTALGRKRPRPVVACTPDLQPVCDALVADGAITATDPVDLADLQGDPKKLDALDGWLTWDGAPGIVTFDLGDGATSPWDTPKPVAEAELGIAYVANGAVTPDCAKSWSCLARAASQPGGAVIGAGDGVSAASLVQLYPLAVPLARPNFVDMEPGRLKAILAGPTAGPGSATLDRLITAPGSADAVVAPRGRLDDAITQAGQRGRSLRSAVPTPATAATVVLVTRQGRDTSRAEDALDGAAERAALSDLGLAPGGRLAPDLKAGELFQIRKKVGGN